MKLSHENIVNESKFSQTFCRTNQDFEGKWDDIFSRKKFKIQSENISDDFFPNLECLKDKKVKESFYLAFIIMIAECQITFEQSLLLTKKLRLDDTLSRGIYKFQREELAHSLAYRHFLNHCSKLEWEKNALLLGRSRLIRKMIYFWVKKYPKSLYLVGAKSEIFSLCYSKFIDKHLPVDDDWRLINKYHFEDELHHIPFAMKVHDQFHRNNPIGVIFSSYVMFLFVQFINITACYNLVKNIFPHFSFFKKMKTTMQIGLWIVRDFEAYIETRKILKNNLKKFNISKFYKLMAR